MFKWILVSALSILCLSACAGLGSSKSDVAPSEAAQKIEAGALVLDVRTPQEFDQGHIKGALNIPHRQIERELSKLEHAKRGEIVVYCAKGIRAASAQAVLKANGFEKVYNAGGYSDLAGLPGLAAD